MEEATQGMEMLIHVAESGKSFEIECQPSTSVELVQAYLAPLTDIPAHDQLLIYGDIRLEPQRSLGSYKLPAEGRHVFLFNRTRLMADSSPPAFEQIEVTEVVIPSPPSASLGGHPLDEASDPALKALPSYERQFKYHFQKGHAMFTASQSKFEACRRLLREQQVQNMALEAARGTMERHYRMIDQMYAEFMKHFSRQHKQHSDLLANFERDLERLRACKLHPALQSESRKTLLDCVKEGNARKCAESCTGSHKQFQGKVLQLKSNYTELQRNVEELFYTSPSVDVHEVEKMIVDGTCLIEEEASIMQSLSKDVNTVKKLVDDCVSSQLSTSLRPHDAVSALGPMYDVHDKNHLPRVETCSDELGKLLEYCSTRKHEMSMCVHAYMQKVAALQSSFRDMRNQLSAFNEAMARQDEIFSDLKLVRRIGPAYKACFAEIVRRKAGMKLYMGQAGQLAEKLAHKREAEIARREEFLRLQSQYISQDILAAMGLLEMPSQCVVNIVPYDTNLLDIDLVDVKHYSPELSVGPLLKGIGNDQNLQRCSYVSTLGSSIHSGSGEEVGIIPGGGIDADPSDDVNSDEIAGTSKLEVENAWLKAELAGAIALLCNLDPNFDEDLAGDSDDPRVGNSRMNAAQRTAEALELKNEHAKHLQNMLKMRQLQCISYEKRIRELEERLSVQYMELQKLSVTGASSQHPLVQSTSKVVDIISKSEASGVTGDGGMTITVVTPEPMDGVSDSAFAETGQPTASIVSRNTDVSEHAGRLQEGGDETMSDFSGGPTVGDAAMAESYRDLHDVGKSTQKFEVNQDDNFEVQQPSGSSPCNVIQEEDEGAICGKSEDVITKETAVLLREKDEQLSGLLDTLQQKTMQYSALEEKFKTVLEDVSCLRSELEGNAKLLTECQMNCAHLENRLHEAREEARTNLCAADRRAVEYNALRASSVKLRGLVERLRHCISAPQAGTTSFVESLRALSMSLGSSDNVEDWNAEFRSCLKVLAERVGWLAQQRAELLDRCTRAEAAQSQLAKELDGKTELLKNLYAKHKVDKQVISLSLSKPVSEEI
eukprot:c29319_g1_i2 orf=674-3847(+)